MQKHADFLKGSQRDARLGLEVPQQETLDQTLVEGKVEELNRCAFETMRKELVQHDERLEKKERTPNVVMQTYVLSDRVICYRTLSRHPSRKR